MTFYGIRAYLRFDWTYVQSSWISPLEQTAIAYSIVLSLYTIMSVIQGITHFTKNAVILNIFLLFLCVYFSMEKYGAWTFLTMKKPVNNGEYLLYVKPFQVQNTLRTQLVTILLKSRWMSPSRFQSHLSLVIVIFNIKPFLWCLHTYHF